MQGSSRKVNKLIQKDNENSKWFEKCLIITNYSQCVLTMFIVQTVKEVKFNKIVIFYLNLSIVTDELRTKRNMLKFEIPLK